MRGCSSAARDLHSRRQSDSALRRRSSFLHPRCECAKRSAPVSATSQRPHVPRRVSGRVIEQAPARPQVAGQREGAEVRRAAECLVVLRRRNDAIRVLRLTGSNLELQLLQYGSQLRSQ